MPWRQGEIIEKTINFILCPLITFFNQPELHLARFDVFFVVSVPDGSFRRAFSFVLPQSVAVNVTLKHLFISPGHNYFGRHGKGSLNHPVEEVSSLDCVAGRGIRRDRFFDYKPDYKGQITFFDWAVYERVRDEIVKGELHPRAFRRNVLVSGVDLNELIDKRFTLGGLELTGSCECRPCYWMDEACAPGAHEFLKGSGGLRARIVRGGKLKAGDYPLEITGDLEPGHGDD